jgi:hypothetical protein
MHRSLLAIPLAGCAMGGAMHQATITGQCATDDVACSRRHPQMPLAVGTHFHPDVSTEIAGGTTPNLRLDSADPSVLALEDGVLVAKAPGASAVLISTDDGQVVDFVHVWVAPVTKISVARRDGDRIDGAVDLAVGEDLTLVPTLWSGAQRLGGDAEAVWSSSAESVTLLRDGSSDRRRIRAKTPGKSTITVALGDAKTSFDIEVLP